MLEEVVVRKCTDLAKVEHVKFARDHVRICIRMNPNTPSVVVDAEAWGKQQEQEDHAVGNEVFDEGAADKKFKIFLSDSNVMVF